MLNTKKIKKLKANIWKLQLYYILWSLMFCTPIIVLFYQDIGLSLAQIMIIQSITSLIFVGLEVPSGYFADLYGRKNSLLLNAIFAFLAIPIFAISTTFYSILLAAILWSIGGVFRSGADSALLYDTLIQIKEEQNYKKYLGKMVFYYSLGIAFASLIGGYLGSLNYRYTYWAMLPFIALLIPLSISLTEPVRKKNIFKEGHFSNILKTLKTQILHNSQFKWIFAYSAIIAGFIRVSFFLYQPYFKLTGLDIIYFGAIFATFSIIKALSAKYSHAIEEKLGLKNSLIMIVIFCGTSFILMSQFIYLLSFIFVFLIQFAHGFSTIVISDYINQETTSEIRATILSVQSLIQRLFFATLTPLIGWIADIYSLEQALLISGIMVIVAGGASLGMLLNSKKQQS